jgi:hypothetical protein
MVVTSLGKQEDVLIATTRSVPDWFGYGLVSVPDDGTAQHPALLGEVVSCAPRDSDQRFWAQPQAKPTSFVNGANPKTSLLVFLVDSAGFSACRVVSIAQIEEHSSRRFQNSVDLSHYFGQSGDILDDSVFAPNLVRDLIVAEPKIWWRGNNAIKRIVRQVTKHFRSITAMDRPFLATYCFSLPRLNWWWVGIGAGRLNKADRTADRDFSRCVHVDSTLQVSERQRKFHLAEDASCRTLGGADGGRHSSGRHAPQLLDSDRWAQLRGRLLYKGTDPPRGGGLPKLEGRSQRSAAPPTQSFQSAKPRSSVSPRRAAAVRRAGPVPPVRTRALKAPAPAP